MGLTPRREVEYCMHIGGGDSMIDIPERMIRPAYQACPLRARPPRRAVVSRPIHFDERAENAEQPMARERAGVGEKPKQQERAINSEKTRDFERIFPLGR